MGRELWSGSLSFGLVNVPVALFSAVRDRDLHFRQLHEKDGSPIETRRFCADEEREVPFEVVGRGYELDNGDQVLIPAPDYPLWTAAVSLCGGKPVHYRCDEQSDWYPDPDDIARTVLPSMGKAV